MKISAFFSLIAFISLTACSKETPSQPDSAAGSDRDVHGCIPSAGYSWCAKTNKCERPWELAKANSFENTEDGFKKFCQVSENSP